MAIWKLFWTNCDKCGAEISVDRENENSARTFFVQFGWKPERDEDGDETGNWICPKCL